MATVIKRRAEDHAAPRLEPRPTQPHFIDEGLFRGVLVRERKRADRSNQPLSLFLVLVALKDPRTPASSLIWRAVVDALSVAKRETDVLGWFERRAVIGLILPVVSASTHSLVRELDARVRGELARRLDAQTIASLSIRLYAHDRDPKNAMKEGFRPVDPLLLEVRPGTDRPTMYEMVKRTLDVIGSMALLVALSPVLLVIAAMIKMTSPGAVFFRQVRVGQMMKPFTMLKFRTMHVNADHTIHHAFVTSFIKSGPEAREAGKNGQFKIMNDPRVTSVGRILRKTSLDELPQFFNVLRGDMSLVGPRPPLFYEVEQYQPWHCRRVLEAKPGITGLWQVAGRSRTTFDDMVRLDLRYAKRCSIWTDLKILLATPGAVIAGKGAC